MKKYIFGLAFITLIASYAEACYVSYVHGLNRYGDNFLAVRTGPSTRYRQIDSLYNGDRVFICDYSRGWRLVYYSGYRGSCYLDRGHPYGDCRRGWVYWKYVE